MNSGICVVVSTYNGERYLAEQLDSLINQTVRIERIHIRDDGSSDGTRTVIEDYASRYDVITYDFGDNIGWRRSFVEALRTCDGYDWYSFCDQDDYWLSNKLESALSLIKDNLDSNKPVLYAGNVTISDANLNPEFFFNKEPEPIESKPLPQTFYHDGMAGGLTYVFNNRARKLLISCSSAGSTGHDRLLMLICKIYGKVIYDFKSYVLYRQHGSNVYGGYAAESTDSRFKKIRVYLSQKDERDKIAESLLKLCPSCERSAEDDLYLRLCSAYKSSLILRVKLLFFKNLGAESFTHDVKLRIKVLAGTY